MERGLGGEDNSLSYRRSPPCSTGYRPFSHVAPDCDPHRISLLSPPATALTGRIWRKPKPKPASINSRLGSISPLAASPRLLPSYRCVSTRAWYNSPPCYYGEGLGVGW